MKYCVAVQMSRFVKINMEPNINLKKQIVRYLQDNNLNNF